MLALFSLVPNLSKYPFKNEESLRTIVAFEMWHSKSYFQPTLLGELYFNKPPLFNWLIMAYSHIFPWSEITARAVSLTFLFLTIFAVGLFSYNLFKKVNLSLLSSLIFLTFGNVLFFYGYLAEIDITFTFFVFAGMISLYLWQRGTFFGPFYLALSLAFLPFSRAFLPTPSLRFPSLPLPYTTGT